jgi:hypothetical protein
MHPYPHTGFSSVQIDLQKTLVPLREKRRSECVHRRRACTLSICCIKICFCQGRQPSDLSTVYVLSFWQIYPPIKLSFSCRVRKLDVNEFHCSSALPVIGRMRRETWQARAVIAITPPSDNCPCCHAPGIFLLTTSTVRDTAIQEDDPSISSLVCCL